LYVNGNNGYKLFPEISKIDYLLVIQAEGNIAGIENSVLTLRERPDITVLMKLNPRSLKSISRII
jgi:hypothetical protein